MDKVTAASVRHPTLLANVAGYLDRVEFVPGAGSDGTRRVHLVGWAFRADADKPGQVVFKATIDAHGANKQTWLDPVRRDDVARAYQRPEMAMCGFDAFIDCPPAAVLDDGEFQYSNERLLGRLRIDDDTNGGAMSTFMDVPRPAAAAAATTGAFLPVKRAPVASLPRVSSSSAPPALALARDPPPTLVVIDDVYAAPLDVRAFALRQTFVPHEAYHKGQRTDAVFATEDMKQLIERRLGVRIDAKTWAAGPNGCFQWCKAGDTLVYHVDCQQWAGVLFLTPDAPVQCGTSLFRSRATLKRRCDDADASQEVFGGKFLDATMFEKVDEVGNVFNRLVLFNARHIHAASAYFGSDVHDGRLFQMFFFDAAAVPDVVV